jgi:hypothetical protein
MLMLWMKRPEPQKIISCVLEWSYPAFTLLMQALNVSVASKSLLKYLLLVSEKMCEYYALKRSTVSVLEMLKPCLDRRIGRLMYCAELL